MVQNRPDNQKAQQRVQRAVPGPQLGQPLALIELRRLVPLLPRFLFQVDAQGQRPDPRRRRKYQQSYRNDILS